MDCLNIDSKKGSVGIFDGMTLMIFMNILNLGGLERLYIDGILRKLAKVDYAGLT
jgi:hypothetical protein